MWKYAQRAGEIAMIAGVLLFVVGETSNKIVITIGLGMILYFAGYWGQRSAK